MSITNYSTLQAAILDWLELDSGDADFSAIVPTWVQLAEARIYRELATLVNQTTESATISSVSSRALPSDYRQTGMVMLDGEPVEYLTPEQFYKIKATNPTATDPVFHTIIGTTIYFTQTVSGDYVLVYYKAFTPLATTSTNAMLTAYPDLFLFAALAESVIYLRDEKRLPVWENAYQSKRLAVENADRAARYPIHQTLRAQAV